MRGPKPAFLRVFWLCLALIGLIACQDKSPRLPYLAPGDVILAFGDSLTYGTGAAHEESYPAVLASLSGRTVINAGIPGEVSASGLERLPALLEEHQPRVLILCHGGNDLLRKFDNDETAKNLSAMIHLARERGISVVLIGVPKPGLILRTAEFYPRVAKELNVPYIDELLEKIESNRDLKSDAIHPNAAGYRQFAQGIYDAMRKAGAF